MASDIRSIGRHTLIYGSGIVIGKLASFLMLPVYTRYLTPADYGVLELLGTTIDVIAMLAGIGLASGVFKFYAEFDAADEKREVISTVTIATTVLALATALAGVAFSPLLTRLILNDTVPALYFRLFFLIYFFQSVGGIPFMLIRAQHRSVLFVALNLVKLIATLLLNVYLIVFLHMGILGALWSGIVASGALAVILLAYAVAQVGIAFSWEKFRALARFGSPLVVWTLGSFVLTFSDRYFLGYFAGAAAVGLYSLAYKFGFLLSTVAVSPFHLVWDPKRFEIARQPDALAVFRRMFFYLTLALGLVGTGILLFVRDTLEVMADPAFASAYQVVPLILVAIVLQEWTGYCNLGLYLRNATHLYAWSAVLGVASVTALNFLLIPRFGIVGAAWATVGAYAIRFIAVYVASEARYPIRYDWGTVLRLCALFAGVFGLRSLGDSLPLAWSVAYSLLLAAFVLVTVFDRFLTAPEQAFVRGLLRSPISTVSVRAV